MSDNIEPLPLWIYVVVIILLFMFLHWAYTNKFDKCMAEKHDRFFCEVYARGGGG